MEKRTVKKVTASCAPILGSGEAVEFVTKAVMRPPTAGQIATSVAIGLAGALFGSLVMTSTPSALYHVVVTNRRLLIMGNDAGLVNTPSGVVVGEIDRTELRARRIRSFFHAKVELADRTGTPIVMLTIPVGVRYDSTRLLAAVAA